MSTQTFKQLAHRGIIDPGVAQSAGAFDGITTVHKFGFIAAVGTSQETVWNEGGLYQYPGSAQTLYFTSGSSLDTAGVGPGAQTVQFYGLDENWAEISEVVSLNGHNTVASSLTWNRVNRAIVRSVGTSAQNVGVIYAGVESGSAGVPDTVFTSIGSSDGQTLQALWTVPANSKAYLKQLYISTGGQASTTKVTATLLAREPDQMLVVKDKYITSSSNPIEAPNINGVEFPEKTDIELRALASAGVADVSAIMDFTVVRSGGGL